MKQRIFTLLLIAFAGLTACKKNDDNQPDIKQYDDQQIQQYMSANSLTGFTKDQTLVGDGETGMYYKIINPGNPSSGPDSIKYQDQISIVYTLKSMDGKFVRTDTIVNHFDGYLGNLTTLVDQTNGFYMPVGVRLALHDLLKYPGASMRVLIPSRLGYGVNGFGTGSVTSTNRIAGNQSLDFYLHVIKNQADYDDKTINNYFTAKGLSGYTKDPLGYYYKVITAGTGTTGEITPYSSVSLTYVGSLLNDISFDEAAKTTATTITPAGFIDGFKDALIKHCKTGTSISVFIPSALAYGRVANNAIPPNGILHFEMQITSVTQP